MKTRILLTLSLLCVAAFAATPTPPAAPPPAAPDPAAELTAARAQIAKLTEANQPLRTDNQNLQVMLLAVKDQRAKRDDEIAILTLRGIAAQQRIDSLEKAVSTASAHTAEAPEKKSPPKKEEKPAQ